MDDVFIPTDITPRTRPAANNLFYRAGSSPVNLFPAGGGIDEVNSLLRQEVAEVNACLLCDEVIEGLANHGVHTPLPAGEAVFEGRARKVVKLVFEDIERSPEVASSVAGVAVGCWVVFGRPRLSAPQLPGWWRLPNSCRHSLT